MTVTHSIIGLDVGDRRIGVAVASLEARIASPLITIDRQQFSNIFPKLVELVEDNAAEIVVVGLPRGMDGQETKQTAIVRQFAADLEKAAQVTIYLQDEAGTSMDAEDELNLKRKPYSKGDVDMLAATYILRDWLLGSATEQLK